MGDQFEIRHLRFAIAASIYSSFRRAAEILEVKPSSLSRGIQQMETHLGTAIFERSSSGVKLTAASTQILRTSRYVVEALDHMSATARNLTAWGTGQLTVGFYTSLSAGNLRSCLMDFHARFPDIEVIMAEGSGDQLHANILDGRIDIAILTGECTNSPGSSMSLWNERIMVALPDKHHLADSSVIYWTDMRDEIFLFSQRDPGPEIRNILLAKLAAPGERPKVAKPGKSGEELSLDEAGKIVVIPRCGFTLEA